MTKLKRQSLDARDLAIWKELEANPQVTNKAIAARLEISEVDVARRLRRLDDDDLMRMSASIEMAPAGYPSIAHLFLGCLAGAERSIADQIQKSTLCGRLLSLHSVRGRSGIEVSIRIAESQEIDTLVLAALRDIKGVKGYSLDLAYHVLCARTDMMMPRDWSRPSISESAKYIRESVRTCDLDDLTSSIIAELQRDGRISIREIARRYSVTDGTIRYRLRMLADRSLVRLRPVRHPLTYNYRLMTRVLLRVLPGEVDALLQAIPMSALVFAAHTTGDHNLHLIVSSTAQAELGEMLDMLRHRPEVHGLKSVTMKDVYFVDSRWSFSSR